MLVLVPILITVVAAALFVPSFLSYRRNAELWARFSEPTKDRFICGFGSGAFWIGVVCMALFDAVYWIFFFTANLNQFADIFMPCFCSFFILVGLFLCYAVPRELVAVDGDTVTRSSLFTKTRIYYFAGMTHAKHTHNGITVYSD
ncbi:MAG: hypothetical protein FWD58_01415 [Firmicutes bacterium]|nr:hypothetical protein [Bacillota bacterium]